MATDDYEEMLAQIPELKLLPAWFTGRMMTDNWTFGLLLTTGQTLAIRSIRAITQDASGRLWLEVEMCPDPPSLYGAQWPSLIYAPTSRCTASVAADHVVMAFELADT
jgi:hypothetical protein